MENHSPGALYFYQNRRLHTLKTPELSRTLQWANGIPLVENGPGFEPSLMASDRGDSVLHIVTAEQRDTQTLRYSPYGYSDLHSSDQPIAALNAERPEPFGIDYLLGSGYRSFSTRLMRFTSADSLSPFDEGGLNAYCYCGGDPVNNSDSTGHYEVPYFFRRLFSSSKHLNESSNSRIYYYNWLRKKRSRQILAARKMPAHPYTIYMISKYESEIEEYRLHVKKHALRLRERRGRFTHLGREYFEFRKLYQAAPGPFLDETRREFLEEDAMTFTQISSPSCAYADLLEAGSDVNISPGKSVCSQEVGEVVNSIRRPQSYRPR